MPMQCIVFTRPPIADPARARRQEKGTQDSVRRRRRFTTTATRTTIASLAEGRVRIDARRVTNATSHDGSVERRDDHATTSRCVTETHDAPPERRDRDERADGEARAAERAQLLRLQTCNAT